MSGFLNELLGGIAGAGRGVEMQNAQREKDVLSRASIEDKQSQIAARKAQADHEAVLQTPEFQNDFQLALGGDVQAKSRVASKLINHPNGGAIMSMLDREPKARPLPLATDKGYAQFNEGTGKYELLGINPGTLASRLKAFGIRAKSG